MGLPLTWWASTYGTLYLQLFRALIHCCECFLKLREKVSKGQVPHSVLLPLLLTLWALATLSQCIPSYQTGGVLSLALVVFVVVAVVVVVFPAFWK